MASLGRRNKSLMPDGQTARFLYTIIKQLDLKAIDWNEVASSLDITNGHAARMRFSRFKQHIEGTRSQPRKERAKKDGSKAKRKKDVNDDNARKDEDDEDDKKKVKLEIGPQSHRQPVKQEADILINLDAGVCEATGRTASSLSKFKIEPSTGLTGVQRQEQTAQPSCLPTPVLGTEELTANIKNEPGTPSTAVTDIPPKVPLQLLNAGGAASKIVQSSTSITAASATQPATRPSPSPLRNCIDPTPVPTPTPPPQATVSLIDLQLSPISTYPPLPRPIETQPAALTYFPPNNPWNSNYASLCAPAPTPTYASYAGYTYGYNTSASTPRMYSPNPLQREPGPVLRYGYPYYPGAQPAKGTPSVSMGTGTGKNGEVGTGDVNGSGSVKAGANMLHSPSGSLETRKTYLAEVGGVGSNSEI